MPRAENIAASMIYARQKQGAWGTATRAAPPQASSLNLNPTMTWKEISTMTFYIYKDSRGEYRWRLRAGNNEIIAVSGEGYVYKSSCREAIDLVKNYAATAGVVDLTS